MAKVTNITSIEHRVAVNEAKLYAAALEGRKRNARLLDLLDVLETNFSHKQQEIIRLQVEQGRAHEEIRQLRNLLSDLLTVAENEEARGPRLAVADLDELIDRFSTATPEMKQGAEENLGEDSTKKSTARSVRKILFGSRKRRDAKKK